MDRLADIVFALHQRWWRRRFPELARFPTDKQAENALDRATEDGGMQRSDWQLAAAFVIGIAVITGVFVYFTMRIGPQWRVPLKIGEWIYAVVMACATFVLLVHIYRRQIRRSLREQLCDIGVPICVPCGYDLRGLDEPRCPECGRPFDPNLLAKE